MTKTRVAYALGAAALCGVAGAQPIVVYHTDFESPTMGPEWTGPRRLVTEFPFTRFAGRMGNETHRLTLDPAFFPRETGQPGDGDGGSGGGGGGGGGSGGGGGGSTSRIWTLSFDLYTIDSWDGLNSQWGPDQFGVNINAQQAMLHSFSNTPGSPSTYPTAPSQGPVAMGFWLQASDSIYRQIQLEFQPRESAQTTFDFYGLGLQNIDDESWGIDNVSVSYTSVPTPGAAGLMALAGIGSLRRKRRTLTTAV